MLTAILFLVLGRDLAALGSDEWAVRDAATRRLTGTLRGEVAALAFDDHPDPEVRFRLQLAVRGNRYPTVTYAAALWMIGRPVCDSPHWYDDARWWTRLDRLAVLDRAAAALRVSKPDEAPATVFLTHARELGDPVENLASWLRVMNRRAHRTPLPYPLDPSGPRAMPTTP